MLFRSFPVAVCILHVWGIYVSVPLSVHPTVSFRCCVHKSASLFRPCSLRERTSLFLFVSPPLSSTAVSFRLGFGSGAWVLFFFFFPSICHVDNPGSDRCCYTRDSCTFSANLAYAGRFPVVRRGAGRRRITDISDSLHAGCQTLP